MIQVSDDGGLAINGLSLLCLWHIVLDAEGFAHRLTVPETASPR